MTRASRLECMGLAGSCCCSVGCRRAKEPAHAIQSADGHRPPGHPPSLMHARHLIPWGAAPPNPPFFFSKLFGASSTACTSTGSETRRPHAPCGQLSCRRWSGGGVALPLASLHTERPRKVPSRTHWHSPRRHTSCPQSRRARAPLLATTRTHPPLPAPSAEHASSSAQVASWAICPCVGGGVPVVGAAERMAGVCQSTLYTPLPDARIARSAHPARYMAHSARSTSRMDGLRAGSKRSMARTRSWNAVG